MIRGVLRAGTHLRKYIFSNYFLAGLQEKAKNVSEYKARISKQHGNDDDPVKITSSTSHTTSITKQEAAFATNLSEDGVLLVEVGSVFKREKKLTVVLLVLVRHRHLATVVELDPRVNLVSKGLAVDAISSVTCAGGISALNHELPDYAVEHRVVVVLAYKSCLHGAGQNAVGGDWARQAYSIASTIINDTRSSFDVVVFVRSQRFFLCLLVRFGAHSSPYCCQCHELESSVAIQTVSTVVSQR